MTPPPTRAALCLGLLLAAAAGGGCRTVPSPPPAPPVDAGPMGVSAAAFFREPLLSQVSLSPSGERIAGLAVRDGIEVLVTKPTRGGEVRFLKKLDEARRSVRTVGWAGEDTILVAVDDVLQRTPSGLRSVESELLSVKLGSEAVGYLGRDWPVAGYSGGQDRVIDWLTEDPDRVLLNWWPAGEGGARARGVRARTGGGATVLPARSGVSAWFADARGQVRAGERLSPDGRRVVVARSDASGPLLPVGEGDPAAGLEFAGFGADPATLYVRAEHEGRRALYEYDLERRALGRLVLAHPEVDVGDLVPSPAADGPWAVEVDADRPELHFLDAEAEREQASIDHTLPGTTNRIVSLDRDGTTAIVRVSGDTRPPEYYLYDREKRELDFLYAAYPELDVAALAPMQPVRYTARDGTPIPGYLTLPRDRDPTGLPVIVYPHDGPTARDRWGWDPTVQFLVSRGFAVLQPNFRGSAGYGRAHERAGAGEWGGVMQDDLADGAHWLVAEGIADPRRIGIYGAGYGGYAALWALVETPGLFRAGAGFGALTDLVAWLEQPESWRWFGDPNPPVRADGRERLADVSPARQAHRIRAPVLIAHGVADPRVPVAQAHALADALEAAGAAPEVYLYRNEVDGFSDERNRIHFHERLAAFFERHLAGP